MEPRRTNTPRVEVVNICPLSTPSAATACLSSPRRTRQIYPRGFSIMGCQTRFFVVYKDESTRPLTTIPACVKFAQTSAKDTCTVIGIVGIRGGGKGTRGDGVVSWLRIGKYQREADIAAKEKNQAKLQ
jgi:hypothetical protein